MAQNHSQKGQFMATGETQAVLGLFGASPPAVVHTTDGLPQGLSWSATRRGACRSQPLGQAASHVAGANFFDLILPGKVVR